jgi:acyl carrier protein phosphodiesterase
MNYLAHLYLADETAESQLGSLLGDFVKGSRAVAEYPPGVRSGIELHRRVDAYTDAHEVVRQTKLLVSPARRRFAGILVDLFFDHFLARRWAEFHPLGLEEFSRRVYGMLREHDAMLPDRLRRMLTFMAADDWLASYREVDAVGRAVNGISRRLRRENTLADGVEELTANYASFEASFQSFFPDLIEFVAAEKRNQTSR